MDTVRKDLKEKIDRMERIEKDKRKNENILLVITERDFFRQEAIRLNQLCKELSLKLDEVNKEMKFLHTEILSVTKKWKDSENVNKQLVVELERNIKASKDRENKLKLYYSNSNNSIAKNNFNSYNPIHNIAAATAASTTQQQFFNSHAIGLNPIGGFTNINNNINNNHNFPSAQEHFQYNSSNGYNDNNIFSSNINNQQGYEDYEVNNIQFLNSKEKEKIIKIIDKLKFELKKERTRYSKIISEFNKILLDKNSLEKIFIESVEEIRKEIMHRKIKDSINNKNNFSSTLQGFNKKKESFPVINDVKFENFLSTDKKKLIEIFIAKDEVVNFLKDNIFKLSSDLDTKSSADQKVFANYTMKNFNFSKNKKINNSFFQINLPRSKTPNII